MGSHPADTLQPPGSAGLAAKNGDVKKSSLVPEKLLPVIQGESSNVKRDKVTARRLQRRNTVPNLGDAAMERPTRHSSLPEPVADGQVGGAGRSSTPTFPSLAARNRAETDPPVDSQGMARTVPTRRKSAVVIPFNRRRSKEVQLDSNEQQRRPSLPRRASRRYGLFGSKESTLQEVHTPPPEFAEPAKTSKTNVVKLASQLNIPLDVVKPAAGLFRSLLPPEQREAGFDYLSDGHLSVATVNEMLGDVVQHKEASESIAFPQFALLFFTQGFSEGCILTPEERDLRQIARKHCISVPDLDHYKLCFDKFDKEKTGHIPLAGFRELIAALTKVPEGQSLPGNRISQLWLEADQNRNGYLDFEEFVLFYRKYFDDESVGSCPFATFYSFARM